MFKPRIFSIAAIVVALAPAAFALNNRSAVSVNGLDTNPCTVASPCRSFTVAIPATAPGGEVVALTTAGYGPFTVNNTMTISGAPGVHAAITATSGDGIAVNAGASDVVILRNLVLIGAGATQGINHSSGNLHVTGCLIRGFSGIGMIFNTPMTVNVSVDDTVVLDNLYGIYVGGDSAGVGLVSATFTNSTIIGNNAGIRIVYSTKVVLANCTLAYNANVGFEAISNSGTGALAANGMLENNTIAHNGTGVSVDAIGGNNSARVTLSQNVFAFNTFFGVLQSDSGVAASFDNNRFVGNPTDGGPFAPATLQ